MLADNKIRLRALEKSDALCLYKWENLTEYWPASAALAPYSHRNIIRYLDEYEADPFHSGQLRLMIETVKDTTPVGLIDLYNVEVRHRRACVGILIAPEYHKQGYAIAALRLMQEYCRAHLNMHQLLAGIPVNNLPSLALFEKAGYKRVATLPDYVAADREGAYCDLVVMSIIL